MQATISILSGWDYPRFTFGQLTKQGIINIIRNYQFAIRNYQISVRSEPTTDLRPLIQRIGGCSK
jgi:hypothetical protein